MIVAHQISVLSILQLFVCFFNGSTHRENDTNLMPKVSWKRVHNLSIRSYFAVFALILVIVQLLTFDKETRFALVIANIFAR